MAMVMKLSIKHSLVPLQQSGRTGRLCKDTKLNIRRVCAQLNASKNDDSNQHPAKVPFAGLPTPGPKRWLSDFTKNSSSSAAQASPARMHIIQTLYRIMKESLSGHASDQTRQAAFMQQLRLADKAEVFAVWPFPCSNGKNSQLVVQYNLSELLLQASHANCLPKLLPLLHTLMKAHPTCSTKQSPELLQFLDQLATLRKARRTSFAVRDQLDRILQPWMRSLQQVMADEEVRFTKMALQSNAAVDQAQRHPNPSTSYDSAAMQPVSRRTPHVEETAFFPQLRPYLWAPPAEQMQILKGDDLSPTALDAYELVKSFVPPLIPEVLQPTTIWCQHRDLLSKIGGGKHGPQAVRSYLKSFNNVYSFDFNAEMSRRRRMEETETKETENGQALPPVDPDHVLSIGADMGFTDETSQGSGTDHAGQDEYYL